MDRCDENRKNAYLTWTFKKKTKTFNNSQALGKTGKVIKIYSDGDLRVALDGQYGHTWTFNPLSVTLIPTRLSKSNSVEESHKNRTGRCCHKNSLN